MAITEAVFSVINSIAEGFTYILIIGVLLGLSVFAYNLFKYKHTIILRKRTGSKKLILTDKFKIYTDPDGIIWWKLKRLKIVMKPAMEDAIEITDKGKMFVEADFTDEEGYCYLTDVREHNQEQFFCQLNSNEKAVLVHHYAKMQKRNMASFFNQNAGMIVGISAIVIILVITLAYWGDIFKPAIEMTNSMTRLAEKMDLVAGRLDGVINNRQIITASDGTLTPILHNTT